MIAFHVKFLSYYEFKINVQRVEIENTLRVSPYDLKGSRKERTGWGEARFKKCQEWELRSSDIKADFSPTGNGILHSCGGIKLPK